MNHTAHQRMAFVEYLRHVNADKARPNMSRRDLLAAGARIDATLAGRAIKRSLTREGLRRADLQPGIEQYEAKRRPL